MINFQYHSKLDMDTFISIWEKTPFSFVTTSLYINYKKYANGFKKHRNITKIDTFDVLTQTSHFFNIKFTLVCYPYTSQSNADNAVKCKFRFAANCIDILTH